MKAQAHSTAPSDDGDKTIQRRIAAGSTSRPITTAPNSVFDAGRQAKSAAEPPLPTTIAIRRGIEKPAVRQRGRTGVYLQTIRQMQVGDSTEALALKHARSFYARANEYAKTCAPPQQYSFRKLSETTGAVWRDA
jgi:hypothetical protein